MDRVGREAGGLTGSFGGEARPLHRLPGLDRPRFEARGAVCPRRGLTITGDNDGSKFTWTWQESGGPPMKPPTRTGFGQTILQDVAKGFCEHVGFTYAESGFRYELIASLQSITTNVVDLAERRGA